MKILKKRPLILIFILGLVLRLGLLYYDYSWDINNHIAWAKDLTNRGFAGFYETQSSEVYASLYPNYPPISTFIFYLLYNLQSVIEKIAWEINLAIPIFPSKLIFFIQSRTFLAGLMKLPAVFADLGIAWLCLLFTKRSLLTNKVTTKLITVFVLFNPAFFYLSALWGQIDSLPIFFALAAIYLLLFTEKYLLSNILFLLGILAKPTALVYLPIYLVFFLKKFGITNFLKLAFLNLLIFYVSFIPFLNNLSNPLLPFTIFSGKIMAAQSLPFVTNGAFNFWVLITGFEGIKDTTPFLFGISYRLWGYIITGFLTVFIVIRHSVERSDSRIKQRLWTSQSDIFFSSFLIAFSSFLFLTKMHERYSLLPLPFLLLASLKNKSLLKWFIILSLISFLNLYHSWPVPKIIFFTDILYIPSVTFGISLLNIILFVYLFNIAFRLINLKK